MRKLLRANFARLWRSRTFWVEMAFMALICVAFLIDNRNNDSNWTLDGGCFNYAFFVPILTAIVTALYIGSEYSDGTMRNKCVIGHQRKDIYLANLIVCVTASVLLCAGISYRISAWVARCGDILRPRRRSSCCMQG